MNPRITYWPARFWAGAPTPPSDSSRPRSRWAGDFPPSPATCSSGYSIALTDLLRREIRRREWLQRPEAGRSCGCSWRAGARAADPDLSRGRLRPGFPGAPHPTSTCIPRRSWHVGRALPAPTGIWTPPLCAHDQQRRSRKRRCGCNWPSARPNCARWKRRSIRTSCSTASTRSGPWWWRIRRMAQDMITRFANILRYNLQRDREPHGAAGVGSGGGLRLPGAGIDPFRGPPAREHVRSSRPLRRFRFRRCSCRRWWRTRSSTASRLCPRAATC